jgi:hypothetical protein
MHDLKNQHPYVRKTHTSRLQEFLIDQWILPNPEQQKQWKEMN